MAPFTAEIQRANDLAAENKIAIEGLQETADETKVNVVSTLSAATNAVNAANNAVNASNSAKTAADGAKTAADGAKAATQTLNDKFEDFKTKIKAAIDWQSVLSALNLIGTLHNAAMLSRNVAESLMQIVENGLTIIGIKDVDGDPIDVRSVVGGSIDNFFSTILGAETWIGVKLQWKYYSTIYTTGANMIYSLRSIGDATQELLEYTAENTGKIGNGLREARIVNPNAYPPMTENIQPLDVRRQKLQGVIEGLNALEDAASAFEGATSNVIEIQQEFREFEEQKARLNSMIENGPPEVKPANIPIQTQLEAEKAASPGQEISTADQKKGVTVE